MEWEWAKWNYEMKLSSFLEFLLFKKKKGSSQM